MGRRSRLQEVIPIIMAVISIVSLAATIYFGWITQNHGRQLLSVQLTMELEKRFESEAMRKARSQTARAFLANGEPPEDTVLDLFETLSFYVRRGVIDRETIWNEFGYWIPGYWTAAKTYVMRYREKDRDPEYYGNFEWLSEELTKESARRSRRSESEVQYTTDQLTDFLRSEADLVPDVPVATSRVLKSGVRTK